MAEREGEKREVAGSEGAEKAPVLLPAASVTRIMRKVLPESARIESEAKESMRVCINEFIHLITTEADYKRTQEHRQTISGDDLLHALSVFRMDNCRALCQLFIERRRRAMRNRMGGGVRNQDVGDAMGGGIRNENAGNPMGGDIGNENAGAEAEDAVMPANMQPEDVELTDEAIMRFLYP